MCLFDVEDVAEDVEAVQAEGVRGRQGLEVLLSCEGTDTYTEV